MSHSDIDDGDRDPRRVRGHDPLFIPELPMSAPKVADPLRFKMPYDYRTMKAGVCDKTDQSKGTKFIRRKDGKFGKKGQIGSTSFIRRDDSTGSTVPESYHHQRLRMNSSSHTLRGEGTRYSAQFREWGYNRDAQYRRHNVDLKEQSRFNPSNSQNFRNFQNFQNRFSSSNFSPQFRTPYPYPTQTQNKDLSRRLTDHDRSKWSISGEMSAHVKLRNQPENLRDESYRKEVDKHFGHATFKERHLGARRPVYYPRGVPRPDVVRPFRPYLWYDWKCQKADKGTFKVQIRTRTNNPRKIVSIASLSQSVKPQIEVTGWRKRVDAEVGFQNENYFIKFYVTKIEFRQKNSISTF